MTPKSPSFTTLVQEFFCDRLVQQQSVSGNTVASYRDLRQIGWRTWPAEVFLPSSRSFRGEFRVVRTRNARLAALHSFMKYAGARSGRSKRLLGIASTRCTIGRAVGS